MPNKNKKLGNYIWFYLLRKHLPPRHHQNGSIYLITFEESFSSSHSIFSVKGMLRSSSYYILELGRPQQGLPPQSNVIFCLQSLVLSACMYVLTFQDQQTVPQWNILSNCLNSIGFSLVRISRERIFHCGRVCWSWKANTYIWAERTRLWRQSIVREDLVFWSY